MTAFDLKRKLVAETLGTALLVAVVVGSGIMGQNLSGGNDAIALLGNTLATAAALVVLIFIFGPVSGAHFNPVVSLSFTLQRKMKWTEAVLYIVAQISGGICGTFLAHVMFGLPLVTYSTHIRTGAGVWTGEVVATFALLLTIMACIRNKSENVIPYAVGLVIAAGYWFTSSTSFANPAVTIARALTDSFSGIRPEDVCGFMAAQVAGCLLATGFVLWLYRRA